MTTQTTTATLSPQDIKFYQAWTEMLQWMREYAAQHEHALFSKEADFPDYIYRMERPYDLPTTIMSASLSNPANGKPVLLLSVSPRHSVFKELELHPFESHSFRKLTWNEAKNALSEGSRVFTRAMLNDLADELYSHIPQPA